MKSFNEQEQTLIHNCLFGYDEFDTDILNTYSGIKRLLVCSYPSLRGKDRKLCRELIFKVVTYEKEKNNKTTSTRFTEEES